MSISDLDKLIYVFSKMPGLGPRSARRLVLHLVKHKDDLMLPLAESMMNLADKLQKCSICGNIDSHNPCNICQDNRRDNSIICIVETISDLWAIERSNVFKGKYHILGGTLSALDRRGPEELNIDSLVARVEGNDNLHELILAMNATVDGQTTSYYITEKLKNFDIKISKLAYGMPVGGELDYLDEGTLLAALSARSAF